MASAPGASCAPPGSVADSSALELHRQLKLAAEEETPLGRSVGRGLSVLSDALRLYGPDRVVTSFNGGKDAVVILHLMRAALAAHNEQTGDAARLRVIFFEVDDEFEEVDAFVRDTVARYDLDMVAYAGVGFAEGLTRCIAEHGSAAFVLGTRRGDPNAADQQFFSPSSDWMPPFMRVNPVLEWNYADVWGFLRATHGGASLPYCSLYADGYTSLGKVATTQRNPALRRDDGSYAPAWELGDDGLERAGRGPAPPTAAPPATAASADASAEARAAAALPEAPLVASSAAILIVGDEILSGKTQDGNTAAAAPMLRAAGVTLRKVAVVPDESAPIVGELGRLIRTHDVVFTSGGLGPTHDDITLKAVAAALDVPLEHCEEMAAMIETKYAASGKELPPLVKSKMSLLPAGTCIRHVPGEPSAWPILQCANVFVLPGVPAFFQAKLAAICQHFVTGGTPLLSRRVLLSVPEERIVSQLNSAVREHTEVVFGSYPVNQGEVLTIITLEAAGADQPQIDAALESLLALMPSGAVKDVSSATTLHHPPPAAAEPA